MYVKHMAHSKRVKIETKRDRKEELPCNRVVYCSGVKGNEKKNGNCNIILMDQDKLNPFYI